MPWLQLIVRSRHPQFAEEILLAGGALSVTLRDAGDAPVLEPRPGETPLWPRTEVVALFGTGADLDPVTARLRETLPGGAALHVSRSTLDDEDWVRVWLRDWKPLTFRRRLWVGPRGQAPAHTRLATVLLDPGLAFGTGTHPTTALCLDWLAGADLEGARVLDYGCGSGVLAIAALRLGAAHATCVDIDPQARRAARENAAANGLARRLRARDAAGFRPAPHDVVLANILARPLVELAPRLVRCVAAGGRIVLAGLLEGQAAAVRRAYRRDIAFDAPAVRDGWARLSGRRRAARRRAAR